ncbi:hypothetical protein LZ554_009417 [Drepanopeziza brunnea f. sp. 'monogermtubi']|nr:hypothetical protein LZ554_009417 [Drepanopeziza brunnea f. sp. 'monogermtubi']
MTLVAVQTQTCGSLSLDTMDGYKPQMNSVRTKAGAAGGFTIPHEPNFAFQGPPGFSLSHTEPIEGNSSGPFWHGEGQQYLHDESVAPQGTTNNGFSDSLNFFQDPQETRSVPYNPRGSLSGSVMSPWQNELSTPMDSVSMSRQASQDSVGAQSQRTTNSFDQSRSTRMYPNVTQMSYHMSSAGSDATGRSNSPAMYTPTLQQVETQVFDNFQYQGEDFAGSHPMFPGGTTTSSAAHPIMTFAAGPPSNMFPPVGGESFIPAGATASQDPVARDSMMYQAGTVIESPILWDNGTDFLESQRSSPILFEEAWALPAPQLATSATDSPFTPSVEGTSPRVTRKPIGPRPSKVASDLAARPQRLPGTAETSDESFKMVSSNVEVDNTPRDHHLYHNVTPQADGLYHCPWEKDPTSNCQHKPEKLKCNYDKFVDSHLKPYKCKVVACKDLQFSSTACLLRHEREAHAMHGHGDKPFACTYDGCERGVPGNGFPRHWNLRDHMKRVHGDPGQPQTKSNASASPPPSGSTKSKKRKAGDEQSNLDKAPKRVATPPVVVRKPQEPSLMERYQEKHQMLQGLVNQLNDPRHNDNLSVLRNAMECIKVMGRTTQMINPGPGMQQNFKHESS